MLHKKFTFYTKLGFSKVSGVLNKEDVQNKCKQFNVFCNEFWEVGAVWIIGIFIKMFGIFTRNIQ